MKTLEEYMMVMKNNVIRMKIVNLIINLNYVIMNLVVRKLSMIVKNQINVNM